MAALQEVVSTHQVLTSLARTFPAQEVPDTLSNHIQDPVQTTLPDLRVVMEVAVLDTPGRLGE